MFHRFDPELHPRDDKGRFMRGLGKLGGKPGPDTLRIGGVSVTHKSGRVDVVARGHVETFYKNDPELIHRAAVRAADHAATAAPDDTPLIDARKMEKALAGFTHNGITTHVQHSYRVGDGDSWEIELSFRDKDGREVGHAIRNIGSDDVIRNGSFVPRTYVSNNEFRLDPAYQAQGFGAAFTAHQERELKKLGVALSILGTEDIGGYAWARAGYEIRGGDKVDPDTGLKEGVLRGLETLSTRTKDTPGFTEAERAEFRALFPRRIHVNPRRPDERGKDYKYEYRWEIPEGGFRSIADVAAYGADHPRAVDGRLTWIGKTFLIGMMWDGEKEL